MSEHTNKSDAAQLVEAEKGNNLSPRNLHLRLRLVEVVLVISLLLNLLHWYVAGANDHKMENRVDNISQETGVNQ
jgi:hypothetical protein